MSRPVFDRLCQSLEDARDELRTQLAYNRQLVQTIVDMRREGWAREAPAPAVPVKTDAQKSRQKVDEVVTLIAAGNRDHERVMRVQVASWRAEGVDDDEIASRLMQPVADEEGVPA